MTGFIPATLTVTVGDRSVTLDTADDLVAFTAKCSEIQAMFEEMRDAMFAIKTMIGKPKAIEDARPKVTAFPVAARWHSPYERAALSIAAHKFLYGEAEPPPGVVVFGHARWPMEKPVD